MAQDEFVIEKVSKATILVRHLPAGVRFLFVMKGRKFNGESGNDPKPLDLSLRNQARTFALHEARVHDWID